jgi:type IV pilus assembly protein PilY1
MSKPHTKKAVGSTVQGAGAAFLATLLALPVQAAVEIPSVPLQSGSAVPPNIMFILDDSGSMQSEIMPDERIGQITRYVENGSAQELKVLSIGLVYPRANYPYGNTGGGQYYNIVADPNDEYSRIARSSYFNTLYYNPAITYTPWSKADGTLYSDAAISCAPHNPENVSAGCRDLTQSGTNENGNYWQRNSNNALCPEDACIVESAVRTYWPATYYTYKGANSPGTPDWNTSNYTERRIESATASYSGEGRASRSDCSGGTCTYSQEIQNFANWYTYYRSRILAARAGIGRAFASLPPPTTASPAPRVGFAAINKDSTSVDSVNTRTVISGVRAFAGSDRAAFFNSLYGHTIPAAGTPLRRALDDVGNYFRRTDNFGPWGAVPGTDNASTQLSCRQNYSILMTDGYWNGDAASGGASSDNDSTAGPTITGPGDRSFTFDPVSPFTDSRSDTLADVAMHHWKNDLRSDLQNDVPSSDINPAFWQHMVTFGVGLGVTMSVDPKAAFAAIFSGAVINWLDPTQSNPAKIDDLLHSAVNSRGGFFSASNPVEFAEGLRNVLVSINKRVASASNVSANSAKVDGDTLVFQASYVASQWTGEVEAFPATSSGVSTTSRWKASQGIPASPSSRKIFTYSGSATSPGALFPTSAQDTALGTSPGGHSIASYLRGARTGEIQNGGDLRNREHVLGDIINSSPVYLKGATATDRNVLFVGANDGMLHAIDAADGKELFAYVPGGVGMSALKTLSSTSYSHTYFADGPMAVSTRGQTNGKNLLVGALGRGGKGVFALNVTTPGAFDATQVLWDRTGDGDSDMGMVISKPIITRFNNGKAGVLVANGINSGNERAVLFVYVLDDTTGAVEQVVKLDTKYGSSSAPNGLSAPRGWDVDSNGTVDFVYAGDLQGNLWKFDLTDKNTSKWASAYTTGSTPAPMFVATDASGRRQPITGGVTIGFDSADFKQWVFFGTGKYLEAGDPANRNVQSLYGLIDDGAMIGARGSNLVERFTVVAGTIATKPVRGFEPSSTTMPADKKGWFLDLKTPPKPGTEEGERIVGEPAVIGSVLLVSSIIPDADPCQPGGRGYVNALNAFTGASVAANFFDVDGDGEFDDDSLSYGDGEVPVGSIDTGVGMNTDPNLIDKIVVVGGSTGKTGSVGVNNPVATGRVSWRELIGD